jgi:RNA polymerase primary sigma factor
VKETREAARAVTSLDRPVGDNGDASLGDLVAGESPPVDEEVHLSLAEEALHKALAELPERERHVLGMRYGLADGGEPTSLEEIGRRLGLTRERVRQIEARALERLAMHREVSALKPAA